MDFEEWFWPTLVGVGVCILVVSVAAGLGIL